MPLTWSVGRSLARRDVGVNLIALLAIAAALALGEYLAAAVVALMMSGGSTLERLAARRSQRELTALLSRAPRTARLRRAGTLVEVAVNEVAPGDVVLVRSGEVVPVDGVVERAVAVVDESALTGESLPVTLAPGAPIRSGGTNAGDTFDVRASRPAAESAYAAIVRLVRGRGVAARTLRAARRPVRGPLPPGHPADRGGRVGGERRSRAGAGGAGGGHALPTHPRRPDRPRQRGLARRPARRDRRRARA